MKLFKEVLENMNLTASRLAITVFSGLLLFSGCDRGKDRRESSSERVWTFTYLKAVNDQRPDLKEFIERNWFAMDSVAVAQGLLGRYDLYENVSRDSADWDFIVAVEYLTNNGYEGIATEFEVIRAKHQAVKIHGLGMAELGRIVRSETVSKNTY